MLKKLFAVFVYISVLSSCSGQNDTVDISSGWKSVILGQTQTVVEKEIGQGKNLKEYQDRYFVDYTTKGMQVSYNNSKNVQTIYFYNKAPSYEHFTTFQGETNKGIDWSSSRKDILDAYGEPIAEYNGEDWRRMEYNGFDFKFNDGLLRRIGIFETDKK